MKYGILIFTIAATLNLQGQNARMNAQAFEAFEAYVYATQITTDGAQVLTSGQSITPPLATIANVNAVVNNTNCDVVVQEELIAGRAIGSNGELDGIDLFIHKLKIWLKPINKHKN